jgi:hypothetical protein
MWSFIDMNNKPNFADYYIGQLPMIVKTKDITLDKKTRVKYKEIGFERNLRILQLLIIVVGISSVIIIGLERDLWIYSLIVIAISYFLLPFRYFIISFEELVDDLGK